MHGNCYWYLAVGQLKTKYPLRRPDNRMLSFIWLRKRSHMTLWVVSRFTESFSQRPGQSQHHLMSVVKSTAARSQNIEAREECVDQSDMVIYSALILFFFVVIDICSFQISNSLIIFPNLCFRVTN